jgi:arsenate reductase (thioredoxin)
MAQKTLTRILILCTGNSCRSQMAEGILKSLDPGLQVFSAGISPASRISSKTIAVMKEINIDLSGAYPKHVDLFLSQSFDYVITVCDHAKETCPLFTGKVKHRLHIGFDDPTDATGTEDEVMPVYRRVRDEIREAMTELYHARMQINTE